MKMRLFPSENLLYFGLSAQYVGDFGSIWRSLVVSMGIL
jgi:hypothetical protein